jgi:hypothetical protein
LGRKDYLYRNVAALKRAKVSPCGSMKNRKGICQFRHGLEHGVVLFGDFEWSEEKDVQELIGSLRLSAETFKPCWQGEHLSEKSQVIDLPSLGRSVLLLG